MNDRRRSELYLHEWAALFLVVGAMGALALSAYLLSPPMDVLMGEPIYLDGNTIDVYVEGRVSHPGLHRVMRGVTVADVLEIASPLPDASLGRLSSHSKVRPRQVIRVPAKKTRKNRRQSMQEAGVGAHAPFLDGREL